MLRFLYLQQKVQQPQRQHNKYMSKQSEKQKFISGKIKKVMDEGVRGKKVPLKQAEAIAYSYAKGK